MNLTKSDKHKKQDIRVGDYRPIYAGDAAVILVWIGMYKTDTGKWIWYPSGEEALFFRWVPGQPTGNSAEIYGCYDMKQQRVHDCNLNDKRIFVCEIWTLSHMDG